MPTTSITPFPMKDPRDPFVLVRPEVDPWLALNPGILDGPTDASIHRAKISQHDEREEAIANVLEQEAKDLDRTMLIDSLAAALVAKALPADLPQQDRRDAAAVAVRLHEARWQAVSRYEAADANLIVLRKAFSLHGWYAADSVLRKIADDCAVASHRARFRVWTGQVAVTARTWAKAALGFLNIVEER